MPDEPQGKQRWREVPPRPDDERWTLDRAEPNPPGIGPPPPLPELPPRSNSRDPAAATDQGRNTYRPSDEMLTDSLRRQQAAAQPQPVGTNTALAAVLALAAIGLIVVLTVFLAKRM